MRENVPLSILTTFKIGGPARFFVTVKSKEKLVRLISALKYIEHPFRVIGAGSNILAGDRGYDGVIIRLGFREIVENQNFIYADAGCSLAAVAKKVAELSLSGLEFACGIPGTIGGAVYGNSGACGSSIKDVVLMVDVLHNGEIISMDNLQCKFDYRTSLFKRRRDLIIVGAYFSLRQDNQDDIKSRMLENNKKRLATQPKGASAGSVFRNPNIPVGRLIDELGLKGTRIGGAIIADKHANFILNIDNATSRDVQKLINLIQKRVRQEHGINLKTEIEVL